MYTQFRGVLCLKSIGSMKDFDALKIQFDALQAAFLAADENDRPFVCQDSQIFLGSNGSAWIFIGSEHKDYDDSMSNWIKILASTFRCEGRVEQQYEDVAAGDLMTVYKIVPGKIEVCQEVAHTEGYGFSI